MLIFLFVSFILSVLFFDNRDGFQGIPKSKKHSKRDHYSEATKAGRDLLNQTGLVISSD